MARASLARIDEIHLVIRDIAALLAQAERAITLSCHAHLAGVKLKFSRLQLRCTAINFLRFVLVLELVEPILDALRLLGYASIAVLDLARGRRRERG